ncbi:hypothetical protein SAMN05216414_11111 [Nitrosovibrio sp. Nv17]|nr:hypothetical protein SAMN05216414_11111 [Nitrosovibrio sp. Nv17]
MNAPLSSVIAALALCLFTSGGYAQHPPKDAADSKKGLERMSKELGLSADQRSKVEALFEAERKKVEAIFEEEKQKLQRVQEETRAGLEKVLTPEQMKKLEQKMKESAKGQQKR